MSGRLTVILVDHPKILNLKIMTLIIIDTQVQEVRSLMTSLSFGKYWFTERSRHFG